MVCLVDSTRPRPPEQGAGVSSSSPAAAHPCSPSRRRALPFLAADARWPSRPVRALRHLIGPSRLFFGALGLFFGALGLFFGAFLGLLECFFAGWQPCFRSRVPQAKRLAVALEMKPQNLAGKPAVDGANPTIGPLAEAVALQRRIEIIGPWIEQEVFAHAQHVLVQRPLRRLILSPGGRGSQLDHHFGTPPFLPDKVIGTV